MKSYTICFALTIILICHLASAQGVQQRDASPITISQSQIETVFSIGSTVRLLMDTTSQPVNIGGTGGPHIYDFKNLPFFQYDSATVFPVVQIPQLAPRFPSNAIALNEGGGTEYPVFSFSNGRFYSEGRGRIRSAKKMEWFQHMIPADEFLRLPVTFNTQFAVTNTVVIDTTYVDGKLTKTSLDTTSHTDYVDGYGTLLLPGGLAFQCLRVRVVDSSPKTSKSFRFWTQEGVVVLIGSDKSQPDTGVVQRQYTIYFSPQTLNQPSQTTASNDAVLGTFNVGAFPIGMAFDGANIWVANAASNTVMKLRAKDGAVLGTFNVGKMPIGVAFDGANIWVANGGSNTVMKLRAKDGFLVGSFNVGTKPAMVAFDGANIWVANENSNKVTKLRASDGVVIGTFSVGANPMEVVFDGTNVWVNNRDSNSVTKLRASDGAVLGTFSVGAEPLGIAFDGASIWVSNSISHNVMKMRATDGEILGTFNVGTMPGGLAFDGANIWVAIEDSNSVTKLRASDGAVLGTYSVGTLPLHVTFDGANIWVTNGRSNSVSKLKR